MSHLSEKQFDKIQELARLQIKEENRQAFIEMLEKEIDGVKNIFDIDTGDLESLPNPYEMYLESYPDVVSDGNKVDLIMKTAPKEMYDYFAVPKVID